MRDADEADADRFAVEADRQLDDLDLDAPHARVLGEELRADMLGDRLDQREMQPSGSDSVTACLRSR